VSRGVDRALYGRRGDPYGVLTALDRRIIATPGPRESLDAVADSVLDALGVPFVILELGAAGAPLLTVSAGAVQPTVRDVPIHFGGEALATMRLAPRRPGEGFDERDERMLADIAAHAGGAVASAYRELELRAARRDLVGAREEERRRLRRDLHDGLGPVLAGLGFTADAVANSVGTDAERTARLAGTVREQAGVAAGLVRQISRQLRPPDLDHLGLGPALEAAADRFSDLAVTVRTSGDLSTLDAATEVATYLVAVEALTNAARHSRGTKCEVTVDVSPDGLCLVVADDGVGRAPDSVPGVGLVSMRERAEELGGTLTVDSEGSGTAVRLSVPRRGQ